MTDQVPNITGQSEQGNPSPPSTASEKTDT